MKAKRSEVLEFSRTFQKRTGRKPTKTEAADYFRASLKPNLKVYHGGRGLRGRRGKPGDNGRTPVKGIDYSDGRDGHTPTPSEITPVVRGVVESFGDKLRGHDGNGIHDIAFVEDKVRDELRLKVALKDGRIVVSPNIKGKVEYIEIGGGFSEARILELIAENGGGGGGVTEARVLELIEENSDMPSGDYGYVAGASGTEILTGSKLVTQISAVATGGAGTITIDGGDSIPIPADVGLSLCPNGNLTDPTIIFSSTDSYFIEYVE